MANSLKSFLLGAGFGIAACAGISQCKYNGKSELPVKQPIEELCKMKWCPYPALVCDTFDIQVSKNAQGGNDTIYSLSPKNQYHEVFAETFTKIICNCLSSKDSLPVKNPLDEMKSLPCEFLKILSKLF